MYALIQLEITSSPSACTTMTGADFCAPPDGIPMESAGLVLFLFLVGIAVGSEIDLEDFKKLKDSKAAFGIGCLCQFSRSWFAPASIDVVALSTILGSFAILPVANCSVSMSLCLCNAWMTRLDW